MKKESLDNRKFLAAGAVIVLVALAFFGLNSMQNEGKIPVGDDNNSASQNESEGQNQLATSYNVECPEEVMEHCKSIANEYDGDISFMYKSQYTNRNGSKYFVKLVSEEEVADTGSENVTVTFDSKSGKVWNVREDK